MLITLLTYIGLGTLAGLIAGTFGVGGGIILVPVFLWSFSALEIPSESLWQIAIATSHACIVITSLGSAHAHHKKRNVNFGILKQMLIGIMLGGLLFGPILAEEVPVIALKLLFALFMLILGIKFLLHIEPEIPKTAPDWPGFRTAGLVIGTIACIIGIGGGSMIVPFLKWKGVQMRTAIGTSSACGIPIAFTSVTGLILTGWNSTHFADGYLGYVYLPAFAGVSLASLISTRIGAHFAHAIPHTLLTRLFGTLVFLISLSVFYKALT